MLSESLSSREFRWLLADILFYNSLFSLVPVAGFEPATY